MTPRLLAAGGLVKATLTVSRDAIWVIRRLLCVRIIVLSITGVRDGVTSHIHSQRGHHRCLVLGEYHCFYAKHYPKYLRLTITTKCTPRVYKSQDIRAFALPE